MASGPFKASFVVLQVQTTQHRIQSHSGGPHTWLHEPAGHDFQHVWTDAQGELLNTLHTFGMLNF